MNYRSLIGVGFVLVLIGAVLPFLMVLKVIQTGFILAFISFAASLAGLIMGTLGSFLYVREHRRRD